ncbi:UvrD-helicase domain-containing protein [Candidatus Poriferisocius sp.]|uniref:UvrD-helicase domain-containing protein n=1 Tax=Candidatus Poriferisocius sp. TaxID=3101276 RepID=UPI003B01A273
MPATNTARDQPDRDAIVAELDSTLFVEAGAGSGKTTELVNRVLALIDSGVAMENIAAITFTEKAAAELKNRLRQKLSASGEHPEALNHLDGAAITTLHGFALRILSQHAIEAGLPPRIEVTPNEAFEDRWDEHLHRLLSDPDQQHCLVLARTLNVKPNHLRELAQELHSNWDLVAQRMGNEPPPSGPMELPNLSGAFKRFSRVAALQSYCKDPDDTMVAKLSKIAERAELLRQAGDDRDQILQLLFETEPKNFTGAGRKANWPDEDEGAPSLTEVAHELAQLGEAIEDLRERVADDVIRRLTLVLGAFTLEAAEDRRRQGVLEYHDLLVMARDLLRHPQHGMEVRQALSERYQKLLLDEFQDTDPIQIELVKLIAAPPDDTRGWPELRDEPGQLFYVGDPKQSIYRFRRADIDLFTQAGRSRTVVCKSLTRNFRSSEPVVRWINALFDEFMVSTGIQDSHIQPDYQALEPVRGSPPKGPPVSVLDCEHPKETNMPELREGEAQQVAQVISAAISQGWSVGDGKDGNGRDCWRPARLEDICILLPTRTSLPQLEEALEARNIAYRIEAGSLIWASRIVREVMATVRALADPTDEVSLVNALRSPVFGCGDDDLFDFKVTHEGRWDYTARRPELLAEDHPVGEAMAWLEGLHAQVRWLRPSQLVERLVHERRLLESSCYGHRRPRDVWRNLNLVIDQARQFEESGGRGLREFVAWVDRKIHERARESDVILSETDDDAVRITTIHAAKGREFPIVILSGTHTQRRYVPATVLWPTTGGFEAGFNKSLRTKAFAKHQEYEDQRQRAEQVRLLYVALTRARDHLVVSTHRQARSENSNAEPSMAEMVVDNAAELPQALWMAEHPYPDKSPSAVSKQPRDTSEHRLGEHGSRTSFRDWESGRQALLDRAAKPSATSPSQIARAGTGELQSQIARADPGELQSQIARADPGELQSQIARADPGGVEPTSKSDHPGYLGLDKDKADDGDDDQPPGRRGRGGTQVGRAVHGVLQDVELNPDSDRLAPLAKEQARTEGIPQATSTVRSLAESVLRSDTVKEAAAGAHWKELFVAAPVEGMVVEGFVDLLYRTGNELVVVDYKTDDIHDDETRQAKIDLYRLQVAAYSLTVEQAVGEPVTRCVLVFARNGRPAEEVTIAGDDLASARAEVRRRLSGTAA